MGDPGRADRLRPLPRRLQHPRDDARGRGQARAVAQPPGGRRRLALRQGPLHVPAPPRRRPHARAARPRASTGSSPSPGTPRSTAPRSSSAAPAAAIVTALSGSETTEIAYGLGRAPAPRPGRALGRPPRVDLRRARRVPGAALDDRRRRARGRRRRRRGRRPRARRRPLAAQGAPERRRDRHDRRARRTPRARRAARPTRSRRSSRRGSALGKRLRASERAVLDLVGPGRRRRRSPRRGGARARLRGQARLRARSTSRATPNARGVAEAWAAAADEDEVEHE